MLVFTCLSSLTSSWEIFCTCSCSLSVPSPVGNSGLAAAPRNPEAVTEIPQFRFAPFGEFYRKNSWKGWEDSGVLEVVGMGLESWEWPRDKMGFGRRRELTTMGSMGWGNQWDGMGQWDDGMG